MSKLVSCYITIMITILVVMLEVQMVRCVDCNPQALAPCLPVIQDPSKEPTPACCTAIKAQEPCLCKYMQDPSLAPYIKSPGAKKIIGSCGVKVVCSI